MVVNAIGVQVEPRMVSEEGDEAVPECMQRQCLEDKVESSFK